MSPCLRPPRWMVTLALLGAANASMAEEISREDAAFFENGIRPLLAERCFRCHGPRRQKAELRVDSRAGLLAGGESGAAIVPGRPKESRLVRAIRYADDALQMPPDRQLSAAQVALLVEWIERGAPWPGAASQPSEPGAPGGGVEVTDADRGFWSFRPLARPPVPSAADARGEWAGWVRGPIDAFIWRRLRDAGLTPAPRASKRALIRRLYFDLVGLPPDPEEVEAFVGDDHPEVYEKLVDRLLARPQFGERWARHWLDVVRFAETNGYERDDAKPEAWRYRDYVVRSLNDDKPYDQFVMEQLAGDELDEVTHDAIIATGFYRLGPWDDEPDDKLAAQFDELDDVVRVTGETFLGLTLGCARCHDHKFDPIPQADYYRILSAFRNVLPAGKDTSATHWQLNPDAVYTPLITRKSFDAWVKRRDALRGEVGELKATLELRRQSDAPEKEIKELEKKIGELEKRAAEAPFPRALSVRERGLEPVETHVHVRGNPRLEGPRVEPAFLAVLGGERLEPRLPRAAGDEVRPLYRQLGVAASSGYRRALAERIVASSLAARVLVNRLWKHHFGRGIVASPNDFGRNGEPPSHPELLDWLAAACHDGGYQLKPLHRAMVLSSAYRQASLVRPEAVRVDPENRLLWRQSYRRLEAEAIRDAILSVSGSLHLEMRGPGVFPRLAKSVLASQSSPGRGWGTSDASARCRRSVYVFVKRTLPVPLLEIFDAASPDQPAPVRSQTTIAPQALLLLNGQFVDEQAAALARRLLSGPSGPEELDGIVERAFSLALSRGPSAEERARLTAFLRSQEKAWEAVVGREKARERALASLAKLIFNLNEFVYVD